MDENGIGHLDLVDLPPVADEPPPEEFPGEEVGEDVPVETEPPAQQAAQLMEADDAS